MTKFFVKWWTDTSRMPDAPQEAVQRVMKRLEMVKADLTSGKLKEWGTFNGLNGYGIIEGTEQDVLSTMLKYMQTILYEVYPILSADDAIAVMMKAAKAMQA